MKKVLRKSSFLKLGFLILLYGAITGEPKAPASLLDCAPLEFEKISEASPATDNTIKHAHNDYEHDHPLLDALANGFASVEADIWLSQGQITISHLGWQFKGTLKDLYLDPLQALVAKQGSVHGDRRPFFLWLEIKDSNPELRSVLHKLLSNYPMLGGPVTAVLTGNEESKKNYLKEYPHALIFRDSETFSFNDSRAGVGPRWTWYSLPWSRYFSWTGRGEISETEFSRLRRLVAAVHRMGRKIRFWDTPDTVDFWTLAVENQIDVIGTDSLNALGQFAIRNTPCSFTWHENPPVITASAARFGRLWR